MADHASCGPGPAASRWGSSAGGTAITPGIAYLPADAPEGVWFRSSEIAVPAAPMMSAGGSPDG